MDMSSYSLASQNLSHVEVKKALKFRKSHQFWLDPAHPKKETGPPPAAVE
jgi:hypothetical protein